MHLISMIAAAGVAATAGAGAAQAAPAATPTTAAPMASMLQPAVDTGAAPTLELVRGGCGFGEHRSWYGRCHYNYGWRGAARYRRNHWRWRHYY